MVSSAVDTQASKPMNAQPPTAITARKDITSLLPVAAGASRVSSSSPKPCTRKNSSSASPTPTEATASAAMPSDTNPRSRLIPYALTSVQHSMNPTAVSTSCGGVGVAPKSAKNQGAARYATVVLANITANCHIQPVIQANDGPASRRLHWYAPPASGHCDASSEYTPTTSSWPSRHTGSAHTHAPPSTAMPTWATAYRPTTGETTAKPMEMLPSTPRLRRSSWW